jgi:hypothetical protein
VASAEYLEPHGFLKCGHKGLFFERFDAGVYDADYGEEIPRLEPFARGLYYVRNRWLDPKHGRWTTRDPNATGQVVEALLPMHGMVMSALSSVFEQYAHFGDSISTHCYVQASPVAMSDPMGLFLGLAAQGVATGVDAWMNASGTLQDAADGLRMSFGVHDMLASYASMQDMDAEWATDWSLGDEDYSSRGNWLSDEQLEKMMENAPEDDRLVLAARLIKALPIRGRWHNLVNGLPSLHARAVKKYAEIMEKLHGKGKVRMNQRLVDANGNQIANVRPDVQWIDRRTGKIHVMEFEHTRKLSPETLRIYQQNGITVHTTKLTK